jgi:hypothetical protein
VFVGRELVLGILTKYVIGSDRAQNHWMARVCVGGTGACEGNPNIRCDMI